jgi:hypothetical protein
MVRVRVRVKVKVKVEVKVKVKVKVKVNVRVSVRIRVRVRVRGNLCSSTQRNFAGCWNPKPLALIADFKPLAPTLIPTLIAIPDHNSKL